MENTITINVELANAIDLLNGVGGVINKNQELIAQVQDVLFKWQNEDAIFISEYNRLDNLSEKLGDALSSVDNAIKNMNEALKFSTNEG